MIPGIVIVNDGTQMDDKDYKFSTLNPHLPLDLDADPKHYDIIEIKGGTAMSITAEFAGVKQETIYTIRHNLGYTPFVLMYFFSKSYDGNEGSIKAGYYSADTFTIAGGAVEDSITFRVNKETIEIVHWVSNFGGAVARTSDADKYIFRIKFYISSIDTGLERYTGDRMDYI